MFKNILKTIFKPKNSEDDIVINDIEYIIELEEKPLKKDIKVDLKHKIRQKTLHLRLEDMAKNSSNVYIKKAQEMIKDKTEDSIYQAIEYLYRVPKDIDSDILIETNIYLALLYEVIEDFDSVAEIYKESIQINNSTKALIAYKGFIERSREVLSWHKKSSSSNDKFNTLNIYGLTKLEDMPNVAKRLDTIAKYYARSPKSRTVARRYFKEVIKMYKKLASENPSEYHCDYINALIDAVEIFMFSPIFLKEAEEKLLNSTDCIDKRVYLLDRIRELKKRGFIKNSGVFSYYSDR